MTNNNHSQTGFVYNNGSQNIVVSNISENRVLPPFLNLSRNTNVKECNQCGKCCIKYSNSGLSASVSQIDYWENYRPEIYRYVSEGNIWVDPETGKQIELCPWLRKVPNQNKYTCDIYYDRPDDCKYYPSTLDEMVIDECEMLEEKDLSNPKQAQKTLDKIMEDSRSPFE